MQPQILVVSDPPHREVDEDAVAAILGLELADVRLKIGFPAPEVLSASDPDRATEVAESMRGAGLNVVVIDGHELVDIPWPAPVSSFEFGGESLVVPVAGDEVDVRYDTPVVGVYCKPPSDFPEGGPARDTAQAAARRVSGYERAQQPAGFGSGADGPEIAEALEWMTNLDLYFARGGELRRISIVQDVTEFSGLGHLKRPTVADDMAATVTECQRRFDNIELDTRLENVRPRHRFVAGEADFDMDLRKLFSFGTLLLRQVLDSISPELRDIPQYELGSRLAYLMSRQGGDASE